MIAKSIFHKSLQRQEVKVGEAIMKNLFNTIGEVKASYRTTGKPFAQITGSKDAATLLRELWDQDTIEYYESFCVLLLNRANKVIAYRFVGQGGTSGVIADPKTIFQAALLANSSALIVAHYEKEMVM